MVKEKISIFILGLLFLSLYFTEAKYVINIGIKITFTDIIIFGVTFLFLIYLLKKNKLPPINISSIILTPFFLFILMVLIDVLRVDWPERNITLFIALLKNLFILLLVGILISHLKSGREKILEIIVNITIVVSLISIIIYCFYFLQLPEIRLNPSLWKPGIWYNFGEGGLLRLSGFGGDPNFFGAVNLIGLVFSLFLFNKKQYRIGAGIIFSAIVLTFSRTLAIVLLALLAIFFILNLILKSNKLIKDAGFNYLKLFIFFLLIFFIIGLFYPQGNIFKIIQERMESGVETGYSERFYLWDSAIRSFERSPIFGQGGRAILMGEGKYVHNDYLEILSSYGLVGFLLMFSFLISNVVLGLNNLRDSVKTGAYIVFLLYVIFMFGFSIFFNSYIYIALGLLWNSNSKNNEVAS